MTRRDLTSETAPDHCDVEAEAKRRGVEPYQVRATGAVNDKLVSEIAADFRRPLNPSGSLIPDRLRSNEPPRAASGGMVEVKPPPGINIIDQMCDAQDRRDRAITHQQAMELARIEELLDRRNPQRATTSYDPFSRQRMGFEDDE
jgi:hypothetical protein